MKPERVRVGVVADTHCPEFLERLPARLAELLEGVDLILHAGDVSSRETLAELARIAPVEAVLGDHDRGLDLPRRRLGRRPGWFEWSWLQVIRHRRVWPRASVGILEIGPTGITASILPL